MAFGNETLMMWEEVSRMLSNIHLFTVTALFMLSDRLVFDDLH